MHRVVFSGSAGLASLTAIAVLAIVALFPQSTFVGTDQPMTNLAAKGDRLSRVVQVACEGSTLSDSAPSCSEMAQSTMPVAGLRFETVASTSGQTTVLMRKPILE